MNATTLEVRPAQAADLPAVVALLEGCGLPTGDVTEAMLASFCIAEADGRVVGTAGLEAFGAVGLLRSLAVAEARRGAGLAARLVDWCEAEARRHGAETAYLLTTTAAEYFRKRGYADVPREAVPAAVGGHAQFRSLCPASATCLRKEMGAQGI
jgi:amino-acid N-acetyltransferase